jgi:hypothetical protein
LICCLLVLSALVHTQIHQMVVSCTSACYS